MNADYTDIKKAESSKLEEIAINMMSDDGRGMKDDGRGEKREGRWTKDEG